MARVLLVDDDPAILRLLEVNFRLEGFDVDAASHGEEALGIATAGTWAAYSVAIAPLMDRYTASRISAVVLSLGWVLIALVGAPQTAHQDYGVGWEVWALLAFATIGPLVTTNVLWFRSLHRIGASRATLVANLQPFVAALVAYVLLSERLSLLQVVGGALIAGGILTARRRTPAEAPTG